MVSTVFPTLVDVDPKTLAARAIQQQPVNSLLSSNLSLVSHLGCIPGSLLLKPYLVLLAACSIFLSALLTSCSSGSSSTSTSPSKTTPIINWPQPAPIPYGTALSSTQLDATANVPGTFTYKPASGTVLNVGPQTLTTSFTPNDTSAYNTATASVTLTVNPSPGTKTTPTITWPTPAAITNPAPLSATQLDATSNVPGTFAYNPPAGTVLDAGTHTLSATFTPNDTSSYNTASAAVMLQVNPATVTTPADFVYFGGVGNTLSALSIANDSVQTVPGSPFTVDSNAQSEFSMAAAGDFVFISCADCSSSSSVILSWKVNSVTGAITQTSSASQSIAMWPGTDPSGKFLYAMSSSVYGFSINQQTGDLSSLPGSPCSIESANSTAPWISPDGTWLCTAGFTGPGASPPPDISCAQRDPSTGAIFTSPSNQVTAGLGQYQGGSPFVKGNYLLANTLQSNSSDQSYSRTGIAVLQIAPSGITPVNSYSGIHGVIAVDPTGTLVGVSGDDSTLTLLSFNPSSAMLTQVAQVTLPQTPYALTFTCDGKYLAVSNGSANTVSVYSVSNNGLQQVGSPVPVTSGASSQAAAPCPNEVTPQ